MCDSLSEQTQPDTGFDAVWIESKIINYSITCLFFTARQGIRVD